MDSLQAQFSLIYDQYIEKIYRFVYLKVNSEEIAQDITSKVFTKGWQSFQKQGEKMQNPGAFLYKIAGNAVTDFYRERARTKVVSSEILPEIKAPDDLNKAIFTNSDMAAVKIALQGLKQESQDIIIWHYLDDMPMPEIAKILGKTEGAVRVALHRGLKELRNKMQHFAS